MLKRILVPLDGTPESERAADYALMLARMAGAELRLLHVLEPIAVLVAGLADEPVPEIVREPAAYLHGIERRARAAGITCDARIREGHVHEQILAEIDAWLPDMIVMMTHAYSGTTRFWIGSVAQELVLGSDRPLVLLRAGIDVPARITRMLVCLDGSPVSEGVLPLARELASVLRVPVTLATVVPLAAAPGERNGITPSGLVPALTTGCDNAGEYLGGLIDTLNAEGIAADAEVILGGDAAECLVDFARSDPGALLAIATHGRSGIARALLGSTAERVIAHAGQPVLLLRPQHVEAP